MSWCQPIYVKEAISTLPNIIFTSDKRRSLKIRKVFPLMLPVTGCKDVTDIKWKNVFHLWRVHISVSCRERFHGKIYINSRPLFIIFNDLFGCPKANFGPLHWQGVSLTYLMLTIVPFWLKSHQELGNVVGSQSPAERISKVWTWNLRI